MNPVWGWGLWLLLAVGLPPRLEAFQNLPEQNSSSRNATKVSRDGATSQSVRAQETQSTEQTATPQLDFLNTIAKGATQTCRDRLMEIPEFPLLMALLAPHATKLIDPKAKLLPLFDSWSSDLLVKLVLEIELNFEMVCQSPAPVDRLVSAMRVAYLTKIGLPPEIPKDPKRLFRGLMAVKEDARALSKQFKKAKLRKAMATEELLKLAYGETYWVRGVPAVGIKREEVKKLQDWLDEVVPHPSNLWDPRVIAKVVAVSQPGVAAYVPELAQFIFSKELWERPTKLNQIVVLHEMVHSAERLHWYTLRANWAEDFQKFSGWGHDKNGKLVLAIQEKRKTRQDVLTELSLAGSPFSILPDPLLFPEDATKDGFVMARSYRSTLEQSDVTEDLADHAAVFRLMPERYCEKGKNIAPQKAAWIRAHLFADRTLPACE